MNTTQTTEDVFDACCAVASTRYTCGRPCRMGDEVVATDGAIAVRGRAELHPAEPPDKYAPPIESLDWSRDSYSTTPLDLPTVDDPAKCQRCAGAGTTTEYVCKECDGDGDIECDHCGHESECEACRGLGFVTDGGGKPEQVECDRCKGRCIEPEDAVEVGPIWLMPRYIRLVQRHGGKLYPNTESPISRPSYIEFPDGVRGLLMPAVGKGVKP